MRTKRGPGLPAATADPFHHSGWAKAARHWKSPRTAPIKTGTARRRSRNPSRPEPRSPGTTPSPPAGRNRPDPSALALTAPPAPRRSLADRLDCRRKRGTWSVRAPVFHALARSTSRRRAAATMPRTMDRTRKRPGLSGEGKSRPRQSSGFKRRPRQPKLQDYRAKDPPLTHSAHPERGERSPWGLPAADRRVHERPLRWRYPASAARAAGSGLQLRAPKP